MGWRISPIGPCIGRACGSGSRDWWWRVLAGDVSSRRVARGRRRQPITSCRHGRWRRTGSSTCSSRWTTCRRRAGLVIRLGVRGRPMPGIAVCRVRVVWRRGSRRPRPRSSGRGDTSRIRLVWLASSDRNHASIDVCLGNIAGDTLRLVDAGQRQALNKVIRSAVAVDMDELAGELRALRCQLAALETMVGLPSTRLPRRERRKRVAELRRGGYSRSAIAVMPRVDIKTVHRDLRVVQAPPAAMLVGLDNRPVKGPATASQLD